MNVWKLRRLLTGVVLLMLGIYSLGEGISDWIGLSGDLKDFNALPANECNVGDYVEGDVNWSLGYYCEEETTKEGKTIGKSRYYLIPFGENQDMLIGIKVKESEFEQFEALCDATYAAEDIPTDIGIGKFQGKIVACDDEESSYLKEFIEEGLELNDGAYTDYAVPYYIEPVSSSDGTFGVGFGIVCCLGGIIIILRCIKNKKHNVEEVA